MDTVQRVFKGTFIHSTHTCAMEVLENHILGTSNAGKILFFEEAREQTRLVQKWGFEESNIEELGKNAFFMPGMVDTHIHAPQYSFIGTGMERPLLEWLKHTTFPIEDTYADVEIASNVYNSVVRRTLKNGTTTACYFATIHTDASILLADIASVYGQRAFIGKICMDSNNTYPQYKENTEESIEETKRFVEVLKKKKYDRVKPIVTPRFAVTCSENLLNKLGTLAEEHQLHIQSHISESLAEIEEVLNLFPGYKNYTDVYDRNKLLTDKTVMAHGCHLSNEELLVFREKGAAISHCPNSNISLCSGHLDVQNILKHKVKLGLGTDIAGGYSISLLDSIRKAIETSKIIFMEKQKRQRENNEIDILQRKMAAHGINSNVNNSVMEMENNHNVLSIKEAFRLATLGGSEALSIDHITGNFEVDKEFDALLIDPEAIDSPFEVFYDIPKEEIIQRFLYLGDDRNISAVYVAGRCVVPFHTNS
ncbi:PREDICTED: guanine deaminase [Nanorana parkeri]|uniref:guanine deaminase n=1 Tax=Nanorana parkeri TaxID=125878 RepID=UPI0008548130|nr:PREDICTED: guanine deaminase [Nanorana parkeri]